MNLFTERIDNWQDWSMLFQSIPAFETPIKHILQKESLPVSVIENLTPGTNAVFKVGSYVVKIFAPSESGKDQTPDMYTEKYAARHAKRLGASVPKVIADGFIKDKYRFGYIISEYIKGIEFIEAERTMNSSEKIEAGRKLRNITDSFNTPCKPFNNIDIFSDEYINKRFINFPENFRRERLEYIKSYKYSPNVFVHGDLFGDNVIVSDDGTLYLIDFADAVLAPVCYEHALIAIDFFSFDNYLLKGFFGNISCDELTEICLSGILIHNFGDDVIEEHIGQYKIRIREKSLYRNA